MRKRKREEEKEMVACCRVYCRLSHEGPGQFVGCPPWGVFLRDPSPYLREFRRKPRKTPNG